jgi:hypothetical protein
VNRILVAGGMLLWGLASPGLAQAPGAVAAERARQLRLRYELQVMERVLEQAVQHGVQLMGARLQASAPDVLLFAGPSRARGFRLEGYGVFFDVEVPALRESLTWSFRVLRQGNVDLARSLERVRQLVKLLPDEKLRTTFETELAQLEGRMLPPQPAPRIATAAGSVSAQSVVEPAPARPPAVGGPPVDDPVAEYTAEVKQALIDAMIDHSGSLTLAADEWLTVAARDAEGLAPGDLYAPPTIVLRIRGADLAAFRAGQVSREETRKRVDVREF